MLMLEKSALSVELKEGMPLCDGIDTENPLSETKEGMVF